MVKAAEGATLMDKSITVAKPKAATKPIESGVHGGSAASRRRPSSWTPLYEPPSI
ncbi:MULTISPECIES: hypothetical protein [Pyrobaculum]|uniref:Uncharacterized protein n=1 Tax=Pyrobaculum arsenaticum TaxID=121277 RepID=A0A7L4P9F2_9CREN|nr:hypothetical protein [Pyrobaculum arsenaticum]MCY0891242.1 hypothetical protein [Pyrobaculum arsenaticum]NYR15531.1 hypothetical protein [Pyrobaculum arsenaticum]